MKDNEYTCAMCGGTFERENEEEARQEFELLYPDEKIEDAELICDDCFKEFYSWMTDDEGVVVK